MENLNVTAVVLNKSIIKGKTVINCLLPNNEVGVIFVSDKQQEYNSELLNSVKGNKVLFVGGKYKKGETLPESEKPLDRDMIIGDTLSCFVLPEEDTAAKELSIYKEVISMFAGKKELGL